MRSRYWLVLAAVTALYAALGYAALAVLPRFVVAGRYTDIADAAMRGRLLTDAENSVRAGAVTLLTGSALGVAGLIAFLSFTASRRDADRNLVGSQNTLFTQALEFMGKAETPVAVGGVSIVCSIGVARLDLREPAMTALFALASQRLRISSPLSMSMSDRSVPALSDRDPIAAAALRAIGTVPAGDRGGGSSGAIVRRRLENSDLRRWLVDGVRFEQVSFVGSYLWDSKFVDCEFVKCVFHGVDWIGVELVRTRFRECDLTMTNLAEASGRVVYAHGCIWPEQEPVPSWLTLR